MSVEAHPNINAAGLAAAVMDALVRYGRNSAEGKNALTEDVVRLVTRFCLDVSYSLDKTYGTEIDG